MTQDTPFTAQPHRLATTDPDAPLEDLAPLLASLADARVIGLGEATHGTREFVQLNHRIIRGLVERQGLRLVTLEANLPETLAVNEYVVDGRSNPAEALAATEFWIHTTESMVALLEWLRQFNDGRPYDDRVRFHGVDAQFTHEAVARLEQFLETVAPDLRTALSDDLAATDDDGERTDQHASNHDPAATDRLLDRLGESFDSREEEWTTATNKREVRLARRCLHVVEQVRERRQIRESSSDPEAMAVRDEAMAENLAWLLEHVGTDRAVVLAHDAHVCRTNNRGPTASAPSLGSHLADRYGANYHAVGFDFLGGRFRAVGPGLGESTGLDTWSLDDPPAESVTQRFAETDSDLLYLPLTGIENDWLTEPRYKRELGAVYYGPGGPTDSSTGAVDAHNSRRVLPEAFDSLLFVRETTPTRSARRE